MPLLRMISRLLPSVISVRRASGCIVVFSSLIQSHVPERLRGRAVQRLRLDLASRRLTSLLLGALRADTLGIRALLLAATLASITATRTSNGPADLEMTKFGLPRTSPGRADVDRHRRRTSRVPWSYWNAT